MDFSDFIKKTLNQRRGYKLRAYRTEYDGNRFKLYHYNTKTLDITINNLYGNGTMTINEYHSGSISDNQSTNRAIATISREYPGGDAHYLLGSTYNMGIGTIMFKATGNYKTLNVIHENGTRDTFYFVSRLKRIKDVLILYDYEYGQSIDEIDESTKYYVYKVPENIKNRRFCIKEKDSSLYSCNAHKKISSEQLPIEDYNKYITALLI